MNRLAIFDCDGTLVDSQHNICAAMTETFARAGLSPPSREGVRAIVGLSLVEAICALLPDAEPKFHAELAESYKSSFLAMRARGLDEGPLYEGVGALIEALARGGWLLGVATGKSDRGLAFCLEHHRIGAHFVTLQTADRHPSKPHPSMIEAAMAEAGAEPEGTLMIGDTSYDMEMARAAGVTAIGVGWGYHDAETLRQAGAHHVADHPTDIMNFVRTLA